MLPSPPILAIDSYWLMDLTHSPVADKSCPAPDNAPPIVPQPVKAKLATASKNKRKYFI